MYQKIVRRGMASRLRKKQAHHTLQEVVKVAVESGLKAGGEAGAKEAIRTLEQEKLKGARLKRDARLRNTRLLLRNYKILKAHCDKSIFNIKQATEVENAVDILAAIEGCDEKTFIHSIKDSVIRTHIILTHIDQMLKFYKIYCDNSDREEDRRKYRVLMSIYFNKSKLTKEVVCQRENIDERTYWRDSREGCEKLGALIFGLDGLSSMSETCQ